MRRRAFLSSMLLGAMSARAAPAQSLFPATRIGWLTAQTEASLVPYIAALRGGLEELGYEVGKTVAIEFRYGDDSLTRVPDMALDLVHAGVRAILVQGSAVPLVAKLNLPVPILFVTSTDPVLAGLADTLAHPRGNLTGLTFMAAELNTKRLELLGELVPNLDRVALLGNPEHPGEQLERAVSREAAQRLGLMVSYHPTSTINELARAFETMTAEPPQGLSIFADGFSLGNRQKILDFATAKRIPSVSGWAVFAHSGAVCTYGPRLAASYRRLAVYVDRILRGAAPADLPIEQPTAFELVINMKAARALGLAVPSTLLARADEVIE